MDTQKGADPSKKKKRERRRKKPKTKKELPKTKVIVRRLPPNLPEDVFMNVVQKWIGDDAVDYKMYIPGKLSTSKSKESTFSRAYFHMKTMDAVIAFHQGFDGHIFMDSRGNESRAVVEFAPYQGVPKEPKTPDSRQGTIEEEPDYIKFLENLETEKETASASAEPVEGSTHLERLENRLAYMTAQSLAQEQANKPKTTPLLEHLRAIKAAKSGVKAKKKRAQKEKAAAIKKAAKDEPGDDKADKKRRRPRKRKNDGKAEGASSVKKDTKPSPSTAASSAPSMPRTKPEAKPAADGTRPKRNRNRRPKPAGDQANAKSTVMKILPREASSGAK
ncbi:hypothetical protein DM01DRAFT_322496 [Hesseltinella vesiculosa]|uniref:UPF3 domain-containing protein n=1 Tax=Hesseltinella vesiculosa TaxID=101127 RepID=A0A1X2GMX8_9FUNG|nr:hypothetical protein DM01DRAFT_322496 [Hesseltinella vesiculosa]